MSKGTEIFVANLSEKTTDAEIREFFERYTPVKNVLLLRDKATGRSKCRAFVEVTDAEEAYRVIATLYNAALDGKSLVLSVALDHSFYNY